MQIQSYTSVASNKDSISLFFPVAFYKGEALYNYYSYFVSQFMESMAFISCFRIRKMTDLIKTDFWI